MKVDKRTLADIVRAVAVDMNSMQNLLQHAGLHATAAQVNIASQKLGWEAARLLERKEKSK